MKKIIFIISALLVAAGCNGHLVQDNDLAVKGDGITYFISTTEDGEINVDEDETKTVIGENYRVLWEETDYISIYDGAVAHQYKATPYEDENVYGTTAYFYPVQENLVLPTGQKYYAMYPYDAGAIWEGSKVTFKIPETQEAVVNNFAYNASVAVTDKDNNLKFCNIGALIRFELNTSNVKTILFETPGGEPLTGKVTVDCLDPDDAKSLTVVEGVSTLTLDGTGNRQVYYVTVLPGDYTEGIKMTVFSDNGYQSAKTGRFELVRRGRINMGKLQFSDGSLQGFQGSYVGKTASEEQKISDTTAPGGFYYSLACGIDVAGANLEHDSSKSWQDECIVEGQFVNPCPQGWNLPTSAQIDVLVRAAEDAFHYPYAQNCYWELSDGSLLDGKAIWGTTNLIAISCDSKTDTSVHRFQYKYSKNNSTGRYELILHNNSSQDKTALKKGEVYRCVRESQQ